MNKFLSRIIRSNPIGRLFKLGEKDVAWKKVTELKAGQRIAIAPLPNLPDVGSKVPAEIEFDEIVSIRKVGRQQVWDIEVEGTHNFVGNGIVAHNTSGLLLRAGASTPTLSSSASSTTADIQLAAADQIDLRSSLFSLSTSGTADGSLKLTAKSNITLDTSQNSNNILLLPGTGNVGIGTTAPGQLLDVNGTIRAGTTLTFSGSSGNVTTPVSKALYFASGDIMNFISGNGAQAMRLDNSGNVGVGTTSPGGILDILGQCIAKGTRIRVRRRRRLRNRKHTGLTGLLPDDTGWESSVIPSASSSSSVLLNVEDVRPGDEVLSLDEATGKFGWQKVEKVMDKGVQAVLRIRTASGKNIRTTVAHPYLVQVRPPKIISGVFDIDISGRVEEMNKDSFLSLANPQAGYTIKLPAREKRVLKILHQQDKHSKFGFQVYAYLIAEAIVLSGFKVKGLRIDHDYKGNENDIKDIIRTIFPQIPIEFISVGKGSPADRSAYRANTMGLGRDKTLTAEEYLTIKKGTKSALKGAAEATDHQEWIPGFPLPRFRHQVYNNDDGLSRGKTAWIKAGDLKPGAKIATADGWEYVISVETAGRIQVYDLAIEATHNFVANGIVAHNTSGLLLRAGASTPTLSSSATSTTADIQLAAADRIDLSAAAFSLSTSNTADGSLKLTAKSNLTLDTSQNNANILAFTGTGNFNVDSGLLFVDGSTSRVGLGTTAPQTKMQVNGDAFFGPYPTVTTATAEIGGGSYAHAGAFSNHQFRLRANNQDWVTIEPSGNVGIGTTAPTAKLNVVGTSSYTSNTNVNFKVSDSTTPAKSIHFGYDTTLDAGYIQAIQENIAFKSLVINAGGGNVGIGTTGPLYQLQLSTDSAAKPTTNTWTIASDVRIKNVVGSFNKGLNEILQIEPIIYTYKENNALGIVDPGEHIGIIAQEVQKVFPEAVSTDPNGYLHFNSDALSWANINAIKELDTKMDGTESSLESLQIRLTQLEDLVALLAGGNTLSTSADPSALGLQPSAFTLSGSYMENEVYLGNSDLISPLAETKLTLDASTDTVHILGDTAIGGDLTVGLVTINDLDASINSLGEPLRLQSLALSNLEIMGTKVVIDTRGNIKTEGEVTAKKVTAEEIETRKLCIEEICVTKQELESLLKSKQP